ncbi:MAG: hypothetical protein J5563_01660, partial [Clostridia bacterium]|nr:hypothetical protein [Clostridia bacterium]
MKREDLINAIGQIDGKTVKSTEKKLKSEKKGGRALLINTVTALVLLAILVPIIKLAVTRGRNSGSEGGKEQTQDSGREAHEAVTDVLLVNDLVSFDEMKSAFYNVMNDSVEIGKFRFYTLKSESDFEELRQSYGDLIQDPPFYYDGFFNDCDMVAVIFGENVVMNRRDVSAEISPDGGVFIDAPAPEANDFDEALSTSCILLDTGRKAGKYYLAKVGLGDYFGGYSIKIEGIEYTLGDKDYVIYSMPSQHGKIEVLGLSELRFRTNSGTIDAVDAFRCGAVTIDMLTEYLDGKGYENITSGTELTYFLDGITVSVFDSTGVLFSAYEYEQRTEEPSDNSRYPDGYADISKIAVGLSIDKFFKIIPSGSCAFAFHAAYINDRNTNHVFKVLFSSDENGGKVSSVTDTGIDVDFIAPVEALDRIKNGMTFDEIVEILGRPLLNPYSGRSDGMLWRIGDKDSFILLHFDEGFSGQPVYRQSGNDFSDIKDSVSGTTAPEETEEPQTDGPNALAED